MFTTQGSARRLLAVGALLMVSAGCGGETTAPTSATTQTTPQVLLAMQDGLQDEYRAAAVYEAVLQRYGQVLPFSNIVRAERQHAASIAALFTARGFAVPTPEAQVEIPAFASVAAACEMGATAEVENIALYDRLLAAPLPSDVQRVFEANRRASLVNHLPAFERCGPMIVAVR